MQNVLLRKEYFGGTLFFVTSGKRVYVNKEEYIKLKEKVVSPFYIIGQPIEEYRLFYTEPNNLPKNNFSFADTAYFEVTKSCNLKCKQCLNNSGKKEEKSLSEIEIKNVINKLCKYGIQEIRFTGGEPLLHPYIFDFISLANANGIRTSIGSNGVLINENVAIKLKEVGLSLAVISLDGMKNYHNFVRGVPLSFEKTLDGIFNLKKLNIPIRVNSVVMKSNVNEVIELTKMLYTNDIPLLIRRFIPSGRGKQLKDELLTKKDYDYLKNELKIYLDESGLIDGHHLREDNVKTRIELPFERRSCSVGQRGIVIQCDGCVNFCGFLSKDMYNRIGNIYKDDPEVIWEKIVTSEIISVCDNKIADFNKNSEIQTNCVAYVNYVKGGNECSSL